MEQYKTYTVKSKELPDTWIFKYDQNGNFVSFECVNSLFNRKKMDWLMTKGRFPHNETAMKHWVKAFSTQFQIEIDLPKITFDYFWELYNNKVGKKQTLEFWNKMTEADKILSVMGFPKYKRMLQMKKDREAVDPIRYLKHRRYEDGK